MYCLGQIAKSVFFNGNDHNVGIMIYDTVKL